MTQLEGVRIGAAVNLLYGFKPLWDRSEPASTPYYSPPVEPLTTFPIEYSNAAEARSTFGSPEITLHDNEESLLSNLFEYTVHPFKGEENCFEMPSGPLILGHADREDVLNQLGRYLGVELREGRRYMLVKLRRIDGRASHAVIRPSGEVTFDKALHLTEEGRKATIRLRPGERLQDGERHDARITAKQAEEYLDFFYRFGTHFVSAVTWGDVLFQVFAYEEDHYRIVRNAYEKDCENGVLNEPISLSYSYYTRPEFVLASGPIVSFSGDAQLESSIQEGRWIDRIHAARDSLFTAYMDADRLPSSWLEPLSQSVPIGIELTPINRFIELFRAFNWQRVLKGALVYRYSHAIRLKLDGIAAIDQCFEPVGGLPASEQAAVIGRARYTSEYRDQLKLEEANAEKPVDRSFMRVSRLLDVRGSEEGIREIRLPYNDVMLISRCIRGDSDSQRMAVVQVPDEAMKRTKIRCETMTGAFILMNESGTERYAVSDGFCFTEGEHDSHIGRSRVALDQQLLEGESPDWEALLPELRLSLADAMLIPSASAWREVVAYARWIEHLLPEEVTIPQIVRLRETAALLMQHIELSLTEQNKVPEAVSRLSEDGVIRVMSLRTQWNELRCRVKEGAYDTAEQQAVYGGQLLKLYDELKELELNESAATGTDWDTEPAPRRFVNETMEWIAEEVSAILASGSSSNFPHGRLNGYLNFINRMIDTILTERTKGEQRPWLMWHRLQRSTI
ncbi:MAC/perforin domain-containing protein [Paenibacillus xylaniclasticus]|uniref:MAC/perforin domain-containing protein n=1 Tax=Paenibacillus xylaniclasticus TaxID=588083 RepID=UPI000FD9DA2C|nr:MULTISPECIES: MAC/perforin domain-containing protein [Paenibacillus]GFN31701.1 hypothetical protein PCURB6_19610 [Paenibacillus curdlanolyticus]